MKILHCVESYYPSVSGAPEVVRHLSERMVKMGHDVTVATRRLHERKGSMNNGVKIVEFNIKPTSLHGMSTVTGISGDTKKYQGFLKRSKFDVVMSYAAQQWTTDLMLPILDDIKAKKILVPCGYSALYDPKYAKYFSELPKYLRKFDATVYMSDHYRDIDFARKHKLKNIHLIPNGADENEFNKLPEQSEKKKIRSQYGIKGLMLMTIANYTGEKGHTELIRVFKRLPLPVATLVSAGAITPHIGSYDDFKKQADRVNTSRRFPGKNVIMVDGSKRDEVIELLKCADIFVFLSNIEASPLVLFESAAAGVPFVATAAGNSREIAQWTSAGIIVRSLDKPNGRVSADIKDAVWQIMRLAFNPIKRRRLGRAGRKVWAEKYTWQKLTEQYLDLYRSLLGAEK